MTDIIIQSADKALAKTQKLLHELEQELRPISVPVNGIELYYDKRLKNSLCDGYYARVYAVSALFEKLASVHKTWYISRISSDKNYISISLCHRIKKVIS
jgi:hypothetical protein